MKSDRKSICVRMCRIVLVMPILIAALTLTSTARAERENQEHFRGILGKNSEKVLVRDGKTLLWAGGDLSDPDKSHWYDFTGAPIPAEQLQFGIGKDRIKAIDDPLFVKPNDPQLGDLSKGWRRSRRKNWKSIDDMRVMGYVINGEARCYPAALLDRHELVNDRIGNKPVTVGW